MNEEILAGLREEERKKGLRMFHQFFIDLALSGIFPESAKLLRFECSRTLSSPIEVLDAGLRSSNKNIKKLLMIAIQVKGFSEREAKETVDEIFRRLENNVQKEDTCACGRTCGCARSLSGLSDEERSLILETD